MQKIVHGTQFLNEYLSDCKKVLLVCGSSFDQLPIKDDITGIDRPYVVFDQFTSNPLYEDVSKGVRRFREERCDAILAVGGGSAIDVAKCIKLFSGMTDDKLYLEQEYRHNNVKLIAIPTTAGTGSESTRYAVIYYEGKKQSVTHDSIVPDIAILEPSVLKSLPAYQKKCTMLDALCQGIESWWSVNSTAESQALSRNAIETIVRHWKRYIIDGDEESAEAVMNAANIAGQAICITQTTAAHAFSYKITSLYGLPHGHAVAVCLPEIWEYMMGHIDDCIDTRGHVYLRDIFAQIAMAMGCHSAEAAIGSFRDMLSVLGTLNPVSTDKAHDLEILSKTVTPIRLRNNPVSLDEKSIRALYDQIVHTK